MYMYSASVSYCFVYMWHWISGSSKMSGFSAVSLPDSHSDYECFVSDIRKDFELRVETVQRTADENTRGELGHS